MRELFRAIETQLARLTTAEKTLLKEKNQPELEKVRAKLKELRELFETAKKAHKEKRKY